MNINTTPDATGGIFERGVSGSKRIVIFVDDTGQINTINSEVKDFDKIMRILITATALIEHASDRYQNMVKNAEEKTKYPEEN